MLKSKYQAGERSKKKVEYGGQNNDPPNMSLFLYLDATLHGKRKNE